MEQSQVNLISSDSIGISRQLSEFLMSDSDMKLSDVGKCWNLRIPNHSYTFRHPTTSQVEDSGDQIPKKPAGKRRKKRWILPEYTGSHPNMEAVFRPENFQIFSGDFRPVSGGKAQESDRNAPKKIQKFSGRNTASMFR